MPDWLWWLMIPAGFYGLHRLACWMESRGWLYWTHSGGHSTHGDTKPERDSVGDN